jgi:undecaprenyl-diphosphatase
LLLTGDITLVRGAVLGVLQGLTEFLPVSSTAHMALASRMLYGEDAGAAFSAVVQLGPIFAMLLYFRADLIRYVKGIARTKSPGIAITKRDTDAKLGWFTIIGTIPLAIAGVALEHKIDTTFRKPSVMGIALVLLALVMLVAEAKSKRTRELSDLNMEDTGAIGLAQVLALIPGASRSGVTITAGLFRGLTRESAARFSFLLSIPAITAAGLFKLLKVIKATGLGGEAGIYVLSAIIAGGVAYAVIAWFLGYMKEHNTRIFIIYRIVLGLLLLGLVAAHKIDNSAPATLEKKQKAAAEQTVQIVPAPVSSHYGV